MSILTKPYFQARKNNGVLFEPDANTVLWFPGQDDAYSSTIRDRSGKGNNGTITGATWSKTGQGLWYLSYDGGDDRVTVAHASSISLSTAMAIETWARLDDTVDEFAVLLRKGVATRSYVFEKSDGATPVIEFAIRKSDNSAWVISPTFVYTINTWYHFMGTFDGSEVALMVNGVSQGSPAAYVGTIQATTDDLGIGAAVGGGAFLPGDISLSRIYNRAPSEAEAQSHYTQERHLFGV